MPHLPLEYTDNIEVDLQPLLACLHEEVVATGDINLRGIQSRAIKYIQYRIAAGDPNHAFGHVAPLIREGRPIEAQKDAPQRVMKVLKETFGHLFETRKLSLTVDLQSIA